MDAAISPSRDARRCARPGCADLAVATLAFRYDRQQAWLTTLAADKTPATYDLCGPCADRTAPPRGWELVDERPALDHLAAPVDERDAVRDAIARALRQSGSGATARPDDRPVPGPVPTATRTSATGASANEVAVLPEPTREEPAAEPDLAPVAPVVDLPTAAAVLGVQEAEVASNEPAEGPAAPAPASADRAAPGAPVLGLDARPALALVQEAVASDTPGETATAAPDAAAAPAAVQRTADPAPSAASGASPVGEEPVPPRRRRRRRPVEVLLEPPAAPAEPGAHRPGRHAPTSHRLAPVLLRPSAAPTIASMAPAPAASPDPAASSEPVDASQASSGPVDREQAVAPAPPASVDEPAEPATHPDEPIRPSGDAAATPRAVDVPLAFDALPDRLVELAGPVDRA